MESAEIRKLAIESNNETWKYLSKPDLLEDERVQMLACAYASFYLWVRAGGSALHMARGHWLLSRVLCVLHEANLAEHHAQLCRSYTDMAMDRKDFEVVYVKEAEARVCALRGRHEKARALKSEAQKMAKSVANEKDRQILEGDIAAEPWFGI